MGLVTLADVHAHLNLGTDTSQDAELQGFIDAATEMVTYLVGPVTPAAFTDTLRPHGRHKILLQHVPVLSVISVTEYAGTVGYSLTAQPPGSTTSAFGYSLDSPEAGLLVRRSAAGTPCPFLGEVVVSYLAGRASVPAQIRMATLEDIRGLWAKTQMGGRPAFDGGGGAGSDADSWSVGPLRLFPRLSALLDGPLRTPTIA